MKRFLLLSLTAGLLSSCGYGSRYEAEKACKDWREKGGSYTVQWQEINREDFVKKAIEGNLEPMMLKLMIETNEPIEVIKIKSKKNIIRTCNWEKETRQFIGFQELGVKEGAIYIRSDVDEKKNGRKVVKRFKY